MFASVATLVSGLLGVAALGGTMAFAQKAPQTAAPRPAIRVVLPREAEAPTPAFPTIQAAIDAVAPGGTVFVRTGTYRANLVLRKSVTLIGRATTGPGAAQGDHLLDLTLPIVVARDSSRPVILFATGSAGEVRNLVLRRGSAGISTARKGDPPSVHVELVQIEGSATGISGRFKTLEVIGSTIRSSLSDGISVSGRSLRLERVEVSGGRGAGVHFTGPGAVTIASSTVSSNVKGGVVLENAAVQIDGSSFAGNGRAGLELVKANGAIRKSSVRESKADQRGFFGDGFLFRGGSDVSVEDCTLTRNARAGLGLLGSKATFNRVKLDCNPIQLDGEKEGTVRWEFLALGDVVCLDCNGAARPCQLLSSTIEPPQPVAPARP